MSTPNASAGSGLVSFKTKLLSAVCSNVVICLNTVSTVSANANDTKTTDDQSLTIHTVTFFLFFFFFILSLCFFSSYKDLEKQVRMFG